MKSFVFSSTAALLPLLAFAAPMAEPAPMLAPIEGSGSSGSAQSCKIVNVDSYVNCRYDASLDAGEIFGFPEGSEFTFACYKKGDCYNGYCTWDQVTYLGTTCYVNGYFTDDNCSSSILPEC